MNLSEETIRRLELKAFLKGMEEAARITEDVIDELWGDVEERSGACSVRMKLNEAVEKLSNELDNG